MHVPVLLPAAPRVAPVDAAWLRMDSPDNLMMITAVLLLDRQVEPEALRDLARREILRRDRFHMRVRETWLPLGRPRWQSVERVDLDEHVRRVPLRAPGDDRALADRVSALMSTPLDRSRPLWQLHVVDGWRGGGALVVRLHHAIGDGVALIRLLLAITEGEEVTPGRFGVAARGAGLRGHVAAAAAEIGRLVRTPADPPTPLRGPLGVRKRAAWSPALSLPDVKRRAKAAEATVNDVLSAALGGALRRYLAARGADLDGSPLHAVVPVNLRSARHIDRLGNEFGLVFLPLPVGAADPDARLAASRRAMSALKRSAQAPIALRVLGWAGRMSAPIEQRLVRYFCDKATLVMTNVIGPARPRRIAGREISSVLIWAPASGRLGMSVSILSYADTVRVGVATDEGLVPDPERIVDGFVAELGAGVVGTP